MDRNDAVSAAGLPSPADIAAEAARLAPPEAAAFLAPLPDADVVAVLRALNPAVADDVLLALEEERRRAVIAAAPPDEARQWARNLTYPDDSMGRIMEPPHAIFRPGFTVAQTPPARRASS